MFLIKKIGDCESQNIRQSFEVRNWLNMRKTRKENVIVKQVTL